MRVKCSSALENRDDGNEQNKNDKILRGPMIFLPNPVCCGGSFITLMSFFTNILHGMGRMDAKCQYIVVHCISRPNGTARQISMMKLTLVMLQSMQMMIALLSLGF